MKSKMFAVQCRTTCRFLDSSCPATRGTDDFFARDVADACTLFRTTRGHGCSTFVISARANGDSGPQYGCSVKILGTRHVFRASLSIS